MLFETQCFGQDDLQRLGVVLLDNFGVRATIHRSGVGRGQRLYVTVAEARKLVSLIGPYVVPEMRYKLPVPCND